MLNSKPRDYARGVLQVPMLGLGAGGLGDEHLDQATIDRLLHRALELGVNLIDTAPSYGESEVRIGRSIRRQRHQFVLSTKVGYGIPNVEDWTGEAVRLGVDRALERFGTDYIDIVHLHSCPAEVLERGEVPRALIDTVSAGKVRVAAYSGDGHALYVATGLAGFSGVQASLSVCDRNNVPTLLSARETGIGTIAKRALANAPWRYQTEPEREDEAEYWSRWQRLSLDPGALRPSELVLRWTAHHQAVDCALVGTRSIERLESAVAAVNQGPLPDELALLADRRWQEVGRAWPPMI